jgi:hypothetical protein
MYEVEVAIPICAYPDDFAVERSTDMPDMFVTPLLFHDNDIWP